MTVLTGKKLVASASRTNAPINVSPHPGQGGEFSLFKVSVFFGGNRRGLRD